MAVRRSSLAVVLAATALVVAACGGSSSSAGDTTAPASTSPTTAAAADCESSVPYTSGDDGYDTFRIPAVVRTDAGTLVAFAEGRRDSASDAGDIETLARRSTDGGCTWGELQVVTSEAGWNRNNPAPVYDPGSGSIVLLTLGRSDAVDEDAIRTGAVPPEQSMRVFSQTSTDDGATFTDPVDITDQIKRDDWRWYAVGPGHGIVLADGEHAGRIVMGANHSVAPPEGSEQTGGENELLAAHLIYSDDSGKTWHIGFVQDNTDGVVNGNETTVAELPDGTVYVNTRNQYGSAPSNRADGFSDDAGVSLVAPLAAQETLDVIPVVEASVLQPSAEAAPLLLSAPSDPDARRAMAIFSSTDGGVTWDVATTISEDPAAYSDLVQLDDHTVGLLYETGTDSENETITFLRIPLADLLG